LDVKNADDKGIVITKGTTRGRERKKMTLRTFLCMGRRWEGITKYPLDQREKKKNGKLHACTMKSYANSCEQKA